MEANKYKTYGYVLIVCAIIILALVLYSNSVRRNVPIIFSERNMVNSLWYQYKKDYLEDKTLRTLDKSQGFITTSEGESYTMLRAVWEDDEDTFKKSWQWTKDNLGHDSDHLFSWLFGRTANGKFGIITERGGNNTASDADTDIALSLIFASSRWKNDTYANEARGILGDIWKEEVVTINGRPYLAANNVEKQNPNRILVNPSYFSPYAYRIFAKVDPEHNWMGLVTTSYDVVDQSLALPLDKKTSGSLPPDWVFVLRDSGRVVPPTGSVLSTNYGFDAMRLPWRVALDWYWYKEPRAKKVMEHIGTLDAEWERTSKLSSIHSHDGAIVSSEEFPAVYGGSLGYFMVIDPLKAKKIYETKLLVLYDQDNRDWKKALSYYDSNWAWFGISLYNNFLPNLYTTDSS